MLLLKNTLIRWLNDEAEVERIDRILWVDPARRYVYTFDIEDKRALPLQRSYSQIITALNQAEALVITRNNRYLFQPEEQFSPKQRQRREATWALIEPIVGAQDETAFIPQKRGELIEAIVQQTGRTKRLIYEYLRRYWREGQVKNALIPRFNQLGLKAGPELKPATVKRGRRRRQSEHPGVNIDEVTKKLLEKGYKRFYISGECKTLTEAHRRTLTTFFRIEERVDEDGITQPILPPKSELPTLRQFKYHCHHQDQRETVLASREGENRIKANYGSKLGSARLMAFGPGAWYLIDSTPADCLLVSSLNRHQVLGKPTLYFVKDLFSMMIVGVEVSLEEASWVTEVLAIQNALTDKVTFCQSYGITINPEQWPCHYAPEFLLGDRGETESGQASNLVNTLGIQVSNTPPYRPDLKGPVELDFHLANHYAIHQLPGGGMGPQHRGDKDQRGLPCLTLYEFRRSVISYILFYNQAHILANYPFDEFMLADGLKPVPLQLWKWGIENRSGHLRRIDPEVAYRNLLPRAQALVSPQGIEFKGLRYFSAHAAEQQWYLKAGKETGRKRRKVSIAYDPRTTNFILLCLPDQVLEHCPLLEKDQGYANREWVEVEAQKAFEAGQRLELEDDRFQALAELHARLEHISGSAQQAAGAAAEQASPSKRVTAKNKREHKQRERDLERQRDIEQRVVELEPSETTQRAPTPPKHLYIPRPDYSDLIQEVCEVEANHA